MSLMDNGVKMEVFALLSYWNKTNTYDSKMLRVAAVLSL